MGSARCRKGQQTSESVPPDCESYPTQLFSRYYCNSSKDRILWMVSCMGHGTNARGETVQRISYYALRGVDAKRVELVRVERGGPEEGARSMAARRVAIYSFRDSKAALAAMRKGNKV